MQINIDKLPKIFLYPDEKWGKKYPAVIKSWQTQWDKLSQYLSIPKNYGALFIQQTLSKDFISKYENILKIKELTSENALLKLIYCAYQKILENRLSTADIF